MKRSHLPLRFRVLLGDSLLAYRFLWDCIVRSFETLIVPILIIGSLGLFAVTLNRWFTWDTMAHSVTEPDKRIAAENQIFLTLAQLFGGGFLLAGLYFTGKSFVGARQSQITERLSSAIESLASDDVGRRIGGIVSLSGLLRRTSADYKAITEIVCSYVRTVTALQDYIDTYSDRPRADVQEAISLIGGRRFTYKRGERFRIDLRGAFLAGADFGNGNFRGAQFNGAKLRGARFFRAHLQYALFEDAGLENASFLQADLRRVSFFGCAMPRAKFRRAVLKRTNLTRTILEGCSFDDTIIIRTTFGSAKLDGATFDRARLVACDFARVPRSSVNLRGASEHGLIGFI